MKKALFLLLSVLIVSSNLYSQSTFSKLYASSPVGSLAKCLATLPDGGFLIGGQVGVLDSAFYGKAQLRKIDQYGNEVWERRDSIAGFDYINDIVVYDSSTIYCAVSAKSNLWVLKRNMEGDILMAKNFFPYGDTCSEPTAMKKTKDGNLIISGMHYNCGWVNFIVLKIDTNLNVLWQVKLPAWQYDKTALDIVEVDDASFVFTGYSNNYDTIDPYPGFNAIFGKLSYDGNISVYKTIPLASYPFNEGRAIAALPGNKFLIAGRISTLPQYLPEASFFVANDTGKIITSFVDSSGYRDENFIALKMYENYAVLLQQYSHKSGSDSAVDFKLSKYDFINDEIIFEQRYLLTGFQEPKDLEILPNGNIAVLYDYLWDDCPQCVGLVVMDSTGYVQEWYPNSIDDIALAPAIQVYPNPAKDYFTIEAEQSGTFQLYNSLGQLVLTKAINQGSYATLDVSGFSSGVYFYNFLSDGNADTRGKLVKE